jgi:2-keto-4-pentenoate hydratase/2-oxohepta-3-ene-1,7-dioic acid hydratase in catechol pathway
MKVASLIYREQPTVSLVDPDRGLFWPVAEVNFGVPVDAAGDMREFIEWSYGRAPLAPSGTGIGISEASVRAPIMNPPHNILCVGKNYDAHAHEFSSSGFDGTGASLPESPIVFTKPFSSINGPTSDILVPLELSQSLDYEAELAVVIGKKGRLIREEEAPDHVWGYTVVNDVTARDLQFAHKQWFLGKGIDGFCPMGPWIVTSDEFDLLNARVTSRVNGELRQSASVRDLIFDIPRLIATISRSMTLLPGDVIATGTPAGVGIGFTPPKFLRDGDEVECEVTGIGAIRNRVRYVSGWEARDETEKITSVRGL